MLRIIGGKFRGRLIQAPKTQGTRPTQGMLRESVFNICQSEIENAEVLDLFAGSGAIGFEALSRGASHITLVESSKQALIAIRKNIEILNVTSQTTLIPLDAPTALKRLSKPFDLIYLDPPYDLHLAPILEQIIEQNLLKVNGTLFVEERHDPKKEKKPFSSEKLFLKSSRRFGTALLHQYLCRYRSKLALCMLG